MNDARCGLCCAGCTYKESGGCEGCVDTNGHPFYGECPIAICCQDKGFAHCGECGSFDGEKPDRILRRFWEMLGKPAAQAKVLFVPTAANSDESRPAAGKCFAELLSAGIQPNNLRIYDIDGTLTLEEAMRYDAIYFTGGDTEHLLRRMRETGFEEIVKKMVYENKVYVGASAGSLIATPNIGDPFAGETRGLCLINVYLSFHTPRGTEARTDLPLRHIPLNGGQALAVSWEGYELIEG